MEQPYPKPMMPWRFGVEKTDALPCDETTVHPGNAHLNFLYSWIEIIFDETI